LCAFVQLYFWPDGFTWVRAIVRGVLGIFLSWGVGCDASYCTAVESKVVSSKPTGGSTERFQQCPASALRASPTTLPPRFARRACKGVQGRVQGVQVHARGDGCAAIPSHATTIHISGLWCTEGAASGWPSSSEWLQLCGQVGSSDSWHRDPVSAVHCCQRESNNLLGDLSCNACS
jgi:hypothetical protein